MADQTFWYGKQKRAGKRARKQINWSASVMDELQQVSVTVDDTSTSWKLEAYLQEAPALIVDETARAEVYAGVLSGRERWFRSRVPPRGGWGARSDCTICRTWEDTEHNDMSTSSRHTGDQFPENVERLVWIFGDRSDRNDAKPEIRRCPQCGTYFRITYDYEWTTIGTDDNEWMSRLTPERALELLPATERAGLVTRRSIGTDEVPRISAPDAAVMAHVTAAAQTLIERLVLFGSRLDKIEWVAEPAPVDRRPLIPDVMGPAFSALRDALADETIPLGGFDDGWFDRGRYSWEIARLRWPELFASHATPFEPLGEILGYGYRVEVNASAILIARAD